MDKTDIGVTITQQLGGGRFLAMCGIKMVVLIDSGIQVILPKQYNGINMVQVVLDPRL